MKYIFFRTSIAALGALLFSTCAFAQSGMNVKWTKEVGSVIKLIKVEIETPTGGYRMAKFTYEALKPCSRLSVYGHNYTKDEIELSIVGLGPTKTDVKPGQKFQHQDVLIFEPGHYLIFDKVHCF